MIGAAIGAMGTLAASAAPRADFYVANNGSDAWSGKLAAPNRARKDGPFASPARAQEAVRAARAAHPDRPVTVLIRGGLYPLLATLHFGGADSGSAKAEVTWAAYPGEVPVLSGGRRVSGWQVGAEGRWQVTLPSVASGAWNFGQLYVNGSRRCRPRLPKQGTYNVTTAGSSTPANAGKGFDRFGFRDGDLNASWQNLSDVEVLPIHIWAMSRLRIANIDSAAHLVTTTGPTIAAAFYEEIRSGARYLVENVKEGLSEPGEWYLDRHSGELTYIPMAGEKPASTEVIAPLLDRLVEFAGASHITVRGITFAHASWNTPPQGNSFYQAEMNIPAAIYFEGSHDTSLDADTIRNTGNWGVEIGANCQRNTVSRCLMTDLGAGGVKIGIAGVVTDEATLTSHNTVSDCRIVHSGRVHPAAIGVWIGQSPYNTITHNEIADLYYTGISVGWTWGYAASASHHNEISYNRIHKIGQKLLSDMGGIYNLGVSPGMTIHHNVLSDINSNDYGGWGIYFDEGSTGVVAYDNLVYDTKSAPFHQHYGEKNVVRNNIFALGREAQLMRTREEDHLAFTAEGNILYYNNRPLLGSNWNGSQFALKRNLYWNAGGDVLFPGGLKLAAWQQARKQDEGSIVADPKFADPEHGDFTLKPGSSAAKIGFQPFDVKSAGPRVAFPKDAPVAPAFPLP